MGRGKKLKRPLLHWAQQRLEDWRAPRPPGPAQTASPAYRMRMLLTELAEHGPSLFTHEAYRDAQGRPLLDGTNNVTERAIGWGGKIRYKLMRGAKSNRSLRASA